MVGTRDDEILRLANVDNVMLTHDEDRVESRTSPPEEVDPHTEFAQRLLELKEISRKWDNKIEHYVLEMKQFR